MDDLAEAGAVVKVTPLYDAIRPLLRVAPSGCYLFERENPREVLVVRDRLGVWLSVASVPSAQRRDEYRVIEWGSRSIADVLEAHFFPSRWELLTWVEERFSTAA